MAEARQAVGFKLAVKPDGKIEIDWSSGRKYSRHVVGVECVKIKYYWQLDLVMIIKFLYYS